MRSRRLAARRARDPADLDITAFMNLMVVLVPFLLITAVFSRVAVLELNLPSAPGEELQEQPPLALEVVVDEHGIAVVNRNSGPLAHIDALDGKHDLDALASYLVGLKQRHPDTDEATVLVAAEVLYETLVAVMDAVRVAPADDAGARAELFPVISIGDAPSDGA